MELRRYIPEDEFIADISSYDRYQLFQPNLAEESLCLRSDTLLN